MRLRLSQICLLLLLVLLLLIINSYKLLQGLVLRSGTYSTDETACSPLPASFDTIRKEATRVTTGCRYVVYTSAFFGAVVSDLAATDRLADLPEVPLCSTKKDCCFVAFADSPTAAYFNAGECITCCAPDPHLHPHTAVYRCSIYLWLFASIPSMC